MALTAKLALKSVPSTNTFGTTYKVHPAQAWLLPIDENNLRCKAAGYSGLKDYLIRKGLKLAKWKHTGLIKELITTTGDVMYFERGFSYSKIEVADKAKAELEATSLLRTSSCSIKKLNDILPPKRIRSVSPIVKHSLGKQMAQQVDMKESLSDRSSNVSCKIRRVKTLSTLRYDKQKNALTQEENYKASNSGKALTDFSGKSLVHIPKLLDRKNSYESLLNIAQISSTTRQDTQKRPVYSANNSGTVKPCQKRGVQNHHQNSCNTATRNFREKGDAKSPNNKLFLKSEARRKHLDRDNEYVHELTKENLDNSDSGSSATSLSMFSARSSSEMFKENNEPLLMTKYSHFYSTKSVKDVGTKLLYICHVAENKPSQTEADIYNEKDILGFESISKTSKNKRNNNNGKILKHDVNTQSKPEFSQIVETENKRCDFFVQALDAQATSPNEQIPQNEVNTSENDNVSNIATNSIENKTESWNDKNSANESCSVTSDLKTSDTEKLWIETFGSCHENNTDEAIKPCDMQALKSSCPTPEKSLSETSNHSGDCLEQRHSPPTDVEYTLENCSEIEHKEAEACDSFRPSDNVSFPEQCVLETPVLGNMLPEGENNDSTIAHATTLADCGSDAVKEICYDQKIPEHRTDEFDANYISDKALDALEFGTLNANEKHQVLPFSRRNCSATEEDGSSLYEIPEFKSDSLESKTLIFLEFQATDGNNIILIKKRFENPLYGQEIYSSLIAISPELLCKQLYFSKYRQNEIKAILAQKQQTTATAHKRRKKLHDILQTEVSHNEVTIQRAKSSSSEEFTSDNDPELHTYTSDKDEESDDALVYEDALESILI